MEEAAAGGILTCTRLTEDVSAYHVFVGPHDQAVVHPAHKWPKGWKKSPNKAHKQACYEQCLRKWYAKRDMHPDLDQLKADVEAQYAETEKDAKGAEEAKTAEDQEVHAEKLQALKAAKAKIEALTLDQLKSMYKADPESLPAHAEDIPEVPWGAWSDEKRARYEVQWVEKCKARLLADAKGDCLPPAVLEQAA